MTLSECLTRDEWNACYFVGIQKNRDRLEKPTLIEYLMAGIIELDRAGHKFKGIVAFEHQEPDRLRKCNEGNENVLNELIDGTFKITDRAIEAMAWIGKSNLLINLSWLHDFIKMSMLKDGAKPNPKDTTMSQIYFKFAAEKWSMDYARNVLIQFIVRQGPELEQECLRWLEKHFPDD